MVRIEPDAKSEAALPFNPEAKSWSTLVQTDPLNLLGRFQPWSQALCRVHVAADGKLPAYKKFLSDVEAIGKNVIIGSADEQLKLDMNLQEFAKDLAQRSEFHATYDKLPNEQFVNKLFTNAGIPFEQPERVSLIDSLDRAEKTRGEVLWSVASNKACIDKQDVPSLVTIHYFAYLHRNPSDPPDNNLKGFDYWVKELTASGDKTKLVQAFTSSIEYVEMQRKAAGQ